jgi:Pyruvate/2-oxoacid:ferredoxin oxidoreductase gamma subunit
MLRRGALAFIYTYRRLPIIAGINGMHYPSVDKIENVAIGRGITSIFVPESLSAFEHRIAQQGQYTTNITLLGVLCGYTELLPRVLVEQVLCQCFPDYKEQNFQALAIGWQHGEKLRA